MENFIVPLHYLYQYAKQLRPCKYVPYDQLAAGIYSLLKYPDNLDLVT